MINYPSLASCRTLILESNAGDGLLIVAPPDLRGRITRFALKCQDSAGSMLEISAPPSTWAVCPYDWGVTNYRYALERIQTVVPWPEIRRHTVSARYQVQVGLIDPQGKTTVPVDRGFMVLADVARAMERRIGPGNVLHVFGYAQGHDRGYPDYSPSSLLGGSKGLRHALEAVHQSGQQAVFYLNPRIAERGNLPQRLQSSILLDALGNTFPEQYNGREFIVMNPGSQSWIEHIVTQAKLLAALGADGIQLDQVSGRNALAAPGAEWGQGYLQMIERIQALELRVWIEGLSDLYPADWFEIPDRESRISADGSVFSGHPLGQPAAELFQTSVPQAYCLVPFVNLQNTPRGFKMKMIIDINRPKGELFLYDADYLNTLDTYLTQAINRRSEFFEST
jgi:hypothetical protein